MSDVKKLECYLDDISTKMCFIQNMNNMEIFVIRTGYDVIFSFIPHTHIVNLKRNLFRVLKKGHSVKIKLSGKIGQYFNIKSLSKA